MKKISSNGKKNNLLIKSCDSAYYPIRMTIYVIFQIIKAFSWKIRGIMRMVSVPIKKRINDFSFVFFCESKWTERIDNNQPY